MELIYRLNNPNYTIYHRAALGGLAATIYAWKKNPPDGIQAELEPDQVRLAWGDELSDQEALRRILAASFKLTKDKMIELPGHGITEDKYGLRLAIHNGITSTFLQHVQAKKGKEIRQIELKTVDDETGQIFTYKALNSYAHQEAKSTSLLNNPQFPDVANIPQWLVPGTTKGSKELQGSFDEVILLLFLMVGSVVFLLKPRFYEKEKAQTCLIMPDVINLIGFAKALHRISQSGLELKRFSNTYLNRVAGGAEEAALRFLIDIQSENISSEKSVKGCQAMALGKVAWDRNQLNRSICIRLENDYPELDVFRVAYTLLSKNNVKKNKKGESYIETVSPIPELIAANLAVHQHWAKSFSKLVDDKENFKSIRKSNLKGELTTMKEVIRDEDDQAIIRTFHEAWYRKMGKFSERATREKIKWDRLVEVEQEQIRNAILRAKTAESLAGWFLRFCADASKGQSLTTFQEQSTRIRQFIFNPRNFERFQNLCLFALVSYSSENKKNDTKGEN